MVKLSYVGLGLNASRDTQAPTSEAHRCKLWIHATLMKCPSSELKVSALLFKQRVEVTKSMKTLFSQIGREKTYIFIPLILKDTNLCMVYNTLFDKCTLQADPHYCDLQFPYLQQ